MGLHLGENMGGFFDFGFAQPHHFLDDDPPWVKNRPISPKLASYKKKVSYTKKMDIMFQYIDKE